MHACHDGGHRSQYAELAKTFINAFLDQYNLSVEECIKARDTATTPHNPKRPCPGLVHALANISCIFPATAVRSRMLGACARLQSVGVKNKVKVGFVQPLQHI